MSTTMEFTDRRRERRVEAQDLVHIEEYRYASLGNYKTDDAMGRTLDLSHDGMRLELDHALQLGTRVRVRVALGETILPLWGRVRAVRSLGRTCEMGIEFVGLTPEQYEALDLYLHLRGD